MRVPTGDDSEREVAKRGEMPRAWRQVVARIYT